MVSNPEVYNRWSNRHIGVIHLWSCLFCLISCAFLMPFDYLLFGRVQFEYYLPFRISTIIYSAISALALYELTRKKIVKDNIYYKAHYQLGLVILGQYTFFLFHSSDNMVFLAFALAMVNLFSHVMSFFFERVSFNLTMTLNAALLLLLADGKVGREIALMLVIWNTLLWVVGCVLRYLNKSRVYNTFIIYQQITGKRYALEVATSAKNVSPEDIFEPKKIFSCVLISDWRDSQNITDNSTLDQIKLRTEIYCRIVSTELDSFFPEGNFYMRTNGDELFVVAYVDEVSSKEKVVSDMLHFARELSTGLFEKINHELDINISFDIGLSCGEAIVGMLGGQGAKKADIIADFVGHAKRFETAGKKFREQIPENDEKKYPVVVLDRVFEDFRYNNPFIHIMKKYDNLSVSTDKSRDICVFHPSHFWIEDANTKKVTHLKKST